MSEVFYKTSIISTFFILIVSATKLPFEKNKQKQPNNICLVSNSTCNWRSRL